MAKSNDLGWQQPCKGPQTTPQPHRPPNAGPRRTLLVVDDQPIQRQMLAGLLLPLGFLVREAASATLSLSVTALAAPVLDVDADDSRTSGGGGSALTYTAGGAPVAVRLQRARRAAGFHPAERALAI